MESEIDQGLSYLDHSNMSFHPFYYRRGTVQMTDVSKDHIENLALDRFSNSNILVTSFKFSDRSNIVTASTLLLN